MASPKNIGDQIFDAVQDAVSSQDFSALQSTIEYSVGLAAKNTAKAWPTPQEACSRRKPNISKSKKNAAKSS